MYVFFFKFMNPFFLDKSADSGPLRRLRRDMQMYKANNFNLIMALLPKVQYDSPTYCEWHVLQVILLKFEKCLYVCLRAKSFAVL